VYVPGELTGMSAVPAVQSFEAAPAVLSAGEYSTLTWTVKGASKVVIDNNIGNVALSGNMPVSPGVTTTYTITASNSLGSTSARTQIIVAGSAVQEATGKSPLIQSFYSDKNYVNPGDAVTLYWNTAEATQVSLEPGGRVSTPGSKVVSPYVTSDYVLTASNPYGSVRSVVTVVVNAASGSQAGQKGVVLSTIPEESGSLVKNNTVYTVQEVACVGDTTANLASRAFLSFNITGIPQNAVIEQATLDLSGYGQIGNPTYSVSNWGNMGALEVYFYQYGVLANLDTMAYNRPAMPVSEGDITDYPISPWYVDVTSSSAGEQVIQNLVRSGQTRCQFRIQFFTSTNWDGKADMLCFDDAKLIVKYIIP